METRRIIKLSLGVLLSSILTSCGEPIQKFKVEVLDEKGVPMHDIEVAAWFNRRGKSSPLDSYKVSAHTDEKGLVELKGETVWYQTSVEAHKEGYYMSMKDGHWTENRNGIRWEPWPVEVKLVMKKIGEPHPMYAVRTKDGLSFKFPTPGKLGPAGFDLELRDWVEPYGKGKTADFIISGTLDDPSNPGYREEKGRRIMSFAKGVIRVAFNNPDDGIRMFEDNGGSKLAGPSIAPVGGYVNAWEFSSWTGEGSTASPPVNCYVFRVRTVRDDRGNIVSARYGKLDGPPRGSFGLSSFVDMVYYFNSGPNDRRLEWDHKTNLFKDLDQGNWPERF